MKKIYGLIALAGLGAALLLAPSFYSTSAQTPDPNSGLGTGEGDNPVEEPPFGEMELSDSMLSSAPISSSGSTSAPAQDVPEEDLPRGTEAADNVADLLISGGVLRPRTNDVSYDWASSGGCIYASSGNDFTIFNTGVYLPQGANVLTMRMYYNDTNISSNAIGWFTVYDQYGTLVDEWLVGSTGSSGQGFNDTSTISHTIDYSSYSYVVNWRPNDLGDTIQLCGFRIYYEPLSIFGTFLPAVLRSGTG